MAKEFEAQVLEVDAPAIARRLRELGAQEFPEVLQRRIVFNFSRPVEGEEWIRLRQVGDKTTLTYKKRSSVAIGGTEEIEVEVADFEKAAELLTALGCFKSTNYQENKRHKFVLNGVEFTLDSWPLIPTILEVEGPDEERVRKGLALVGFKDGEFGHFGLLKIYARYGIDLHSFKELKF